jgi:hypothetical protein
MANIHPKNLPWSQFISINAQGFEQFKVNKGVTIHLLKQISNAWGCFFVHAWGGYVIDAWECVMLYP